jgi:gliding-associated putative ABC transporter substrate-binding component GldG
MDRILSLFPSSIDTLLNKEIKKTVLLSTDTNTRLITTPNLVSINSVRDEADLYSFKQHKVPVAVLLEGKFNSLYANRISMSLRDSIKFNTGNEYLPKGIADAKQIVIADADIVTNKTTKNQNGETMPIPMGMLPFDEFQFANKNFYLNAISYLNEPVGLLDSRNKTIILRLLDREKIADSRLFWQIALLFGPIIILGVFFIIWTSYRKRQFAS